MKQLLLNITISAFLVASASAIEIPRGIFRLSEIDTARTEAAENELAVAYVSFPENAKIS